MKLFSRCINYYSATIFFLSWIFIFSSTIGGAKNIEDIIATIGGIPFTNNRIDIFPSVKWIHVTAPPIVASLHFFYTETLDIFKYTVFRYKSILAWMGDRIVVCVALNILYILPPFIIWAIVFNADFTIVFITSILFFLHTLTASMICLLTLVISRNSIVSVVAFAFINIINVVSSLSQTLHKYAIISYGMVVRTDLFENTNYIPVATAFMVLVLLGTLTTLAIFSFTSKKLDIA